MGLFCSGQSMRVACSRYDHLLHRDRRAAGVSAGTTPASAWSGGDVLRSKAFTAGYKLAHVGGGEGHLLRSRPHWSCKADWTSTRPSSDDQRQPQRALKTTSTIWNTATFKASAGLVGLRVLCTFRTGSITGIDMPPSKTTLSGKLERTPDTQQKRAVQAQMTEPKPPQIAD